MHAECQNKPAIDVNNFAANTWVGVRLKKGRSWLKGVE